MKRLLTLLYIIMVCSAIANAQSYIWHIQKQEAGKGTITVIQSKEITELVNGPRPEASANNNKAKTPTDTAKPKNTTSNSTTTAAAKTQKADDKSSVDDENATVIDTSKKVRRGGAKVTGYRVQVYSGGNSRADRTKAESIGNALKGQMPEYPVYTHFYSPRWVCRIGNFRTYEEAAECLKRAKALGYSQSCIVKGQIIVYD